MTPPSFEEIRAELEEWRDRGTRFYDLEWLLLRNDFSRNQANVLRQLAKGNDRAWGPFRSKLRQALHDTPPCRYKPADVFRVQGGNAMGDWLVVPAHQFRPAVHEILDRMRDPDWEYENYRARSGVMRGVNHPMPFGVKQWLARETGIGARRIYDAIENPDVKYVQLRYADPILVALQRTHLLHDGTLDVLPHPHWPPHLIEKAAGGPVPDLYVEEAA